MVGHGLPFQGTLTILGDLNDDYYSPNLLPLFFSYHQEYEFRCHSCFLVMNYLTVICLVSPQDVAKYTTLWVVLHPFQSPKDGGNMFSHPNISEAFSGTCLSLSHLISPLLLLSFRFLCKSCLEPVSLVSALTALKRHRANICSRVLLEVWE